jgi:glycine oxidase
MSEHPDRRRVVVLGAGVFGCAAAYELAGAGLQVTLIERDAIGAHASGRNAGYLNPLQGTPPALIPFALRSFHRHREIAAELDRLGCANALPSPAVRVHLGRADEDRVELASLATLFEATDGFSAQWLGREALRRLEPRLAPDAAFGVLTRGSLVVEGGDLTLALAHGAAKLGAAIVRDNALGLVAAGGSVTGVTTAAGVIGCDEIVLATGPWVTQLRSWLGIEVEVEPVKGEILRLRLAGDPTACDLTWGSTSLYRRRENEIWVGATEARVGLDEAPTTEAREALLDRAARIMPEIRRATVVDHLAGLRPATKSGAPIVARAQGWRNVYIANGGGSKGMLLSVGVAQVLRDLVTEGHAVGPRADRLA